LIEKTIKNGVLESLRQSLKPNKSKGQLEHSLTGHRSTLEAGFKYHPMSVGRPEIPLREPLDNEFKLNRKMAKMIYKQEKLEKVKKLKED